MVDPAGLAGLPRLISTPRLSPYVVACGGDTSEAVRLYTWNVEASAAFWGCVHALEVGLRNRMHDKLVLRFRRQDWWNTPGLRLHRVTQDQLRSGQIAAAKVAKKSSRPVVPDDVVAALSFGFWSGILGPGGVSQYETQFWQPALRRAFPGYVGTRKALHKELESLRFFRNRLAHHEPIFARHLAADLESILRVAGYMSADLAKYIDSHNTVHETLARRQRAVSLGYATRF